MTRRAFPVLVALLLAPVLNHWLQAAAPTAAMAPRAGAPRTAPAKPDANKPADTGVVILDTQSSWRMHNTLQAPVIQLDGQLKTVLSSYFIDKETTPPPADWMKSNFDDSSWPREAATRSSRTSTLARLCLRGRFTVADPAKVNDLRLNVDFQGGAIVYLNGKEFHRSGIQANAALADPYPAEASVGADGKIIAERGRTPDTLRRVALRKRSITDLAIPKDLLVPGVNVLAIEIVRAPYDKVMEEKKIVEGKWTRYDLNWNTCEVIRIELEAASEAGLTPNARRPRGFQVWNADILAGDFDIQFGDPAEPLRPIDIRGARNGWFSGKVVVGSDQPIRGLKATVSDLKGAAGAIPSGEVRVRYGFPWGREDLTIHHVAYPNPYPRGVTLFGAIADAPLAEYPVTQPRPPARGGRPVPPSDERLGAVVPVWATVHIPAGAAAGEYSGQLTIQAEGLPPCAVPLRVKVVDWTLPDPQDYRTWVELIQVPDTLSVEYGVPLWSEKHWGLIAQSMSYLKDVGSRVVYVPLIAQNNLGNAESMVRWVKKGGDRYEYDFSVMDKYLDAAQKNMGKPKLVIFEVWEVYMIRKDKYTDEKLSGQPEATAQYRQARNMMNGTGAVVTMLDRASGKTENVTMPDYADANCKAPWRDLFGEIRKRMRQRGLEGAMALGTISDFPPTKGEIAFFKEVTPELPWVIHSHHGGGPPYGMSPVAYATRVWNNGFPTGDPAKGRQHGWQGKGLIANYQRTNGVMDFSHTAWHNMAEMNIGGGQRGIGRLGADFWEAVRDKNGARKGSVAARYPQSSRRNLDLYTSMLAPGADGPVATTRLEVFRQGVEECEARIVIDQALVDKALREKLGEELAQRCQDALDERDWCTIKGMAHLQLCGPAWLYGSWYDMEGPAGHIWNLGSGWQGRAEKLFSLAAEVARKLR